VRAVNLKSKVFLDGQTTNPTLISKNPKVTKRLDKKEDIKKYKVKYLYTSEYDLVVKTHSKALDWLLHGDK